MEQNNKKEIVFKRKIDLATFQEKGRVIIVYGPRRVGKTTISKEFLSNFKDMDKVKYAVGDDLILQNLFNNQDREKILSYVKPYDAILIDEAQQIKNIGIAVKMIIDEYRDMTIILTGSSSFILSQTISDPLIGRNYSTILLPISLMELPGNDFDKYRNLEEYIIYGMYPEVLAQSDVKKKKLKLQEIISSYLFKDALSFDKLKSPELLVNIIKALAFQIGSEVSIAKLAKDVGEKDEKKVLRYLTLLEKNFIIKKISAYSKNIRNEINKKNKYYFYDTGIRNAIIERFVGFENRDGFDIGGLFENFVIMELYKKETIENPYFNNIYFWRSTISGEVDIVILKDDKIYAYECKFKKMNTKNLYLFKESYKDAEINIINKDNLLNFLL